MTASAISEAVIASTERGGGGFRTCGPWWGAGWGGCRTAVVRARTSELRCWLCQGLHCGGRAALQCVSVSGMSAAQGADRWPLVASFVVHHHCWRSSKPVLLPHRRTPIPHCCCHHHHSLRHVPCAIRKCSAGAPGWASSSCTPGLRRTNQSCRPTTRCVSLRWCHVPFMALAPHRFLRFCAYFPR
jgi:hypothetical protein